MAFDLSFSAMAARSDASPARWRRPFIAWLDGIERGWSVPLLLVGFDVVWTSFLVISYAGSDLHPDTLETWSLGRRFGWGNEKHPPLMGWVARAWTSVFPVADWSFQLLAMANAALALFVIDLIVRRFASSEQRVVVLLLLMLMPVYQFHAQRFNANAVLLALWPAAIYCFLRAFETRQIGWSVAAGAFSALALLGKYYSIFLIASFVFAAVLHPERRRYFWSASPWISSLAGLALLAPHLHWILTSGPASPVDYALLHTGAGLSVSLKEAFSFVVGLILAMSGAILAWIFIAGNRLKQMPEDLRRMNSGLRLLSLIACGTIIFPIAAGLVLGMDLPSLWAFQGIFLFVVVIVCSVRYKITRFHCVNLTVLVAAASLLAVIVAAPLHAAYRNRHGYEEGRNLYRAAAVELARQWHLKVDAPLSTVSGVEPLAQGTEFYSADHPYYAHSSVFEDAGRSERGWAGLCFAEQLDCASWLKQKADSSERGILLHFDVQSELLGRPGVKRGIVALVMPPVQARQQGPR